MAGPIEQIAAKALAQAQADPSQKAGDSGKFEQVRQSASAGKNSATELPPMKEVDPAEQSRIERELRRKIEQTGGADPSTLYSKDLKQMKKQIQQVKAKVNATPPTQAPAGLQDRLSAIEAQYNASEQKIQSMPDGNNLRDLLAMQTEMYKMSQNIELLSKVVDSATSGVKSTLQMQI